MTGFSILDGVVLAPHDKPDGAAVAPPAQLDPEELKRRTAQSRDIAASIGQLVSLYMRAQQYRHTMLCELEWVLMPAIAARQFRVVEGVIQDRGIVAPVAAVLWASVNADVDKRLCEVPERPIKLKPDEWRCGDTVWIVEALGDQKAVTAMLQHLKQNELKDKVVRMKVRGQDGKLTIGRLELQPEGA
jgi:cytolysin-activating lysine-acyltransferase